MTHYAALGVSSFATDEEIREAYRTRAFAQHPDKVPAEQRAEASDAFAPIQAAYTVLSDPRQRAEYDATRSMQAEQEEEADDRPAGFDPAKVYVMGRLGGVGMQGKGFHTRGFNLRTEKKQGNPDWPKEEEEAVAGTSGEPAAPKFAKLPTLS